MAIYITPKSEIDEYFASERLSQSKLKSLQNGLHNFLGNRSESEEPYYKEKEHFIVGSAVDLILTGEEGQFEKDYYVSEIEKPGEAIQSIIHQVFDMMFEWFEHEKADLNKPSTYNLTDFLNESGQSLYNYQNYIIATCNSQEYCMKMSDEVRVTRIVSNNEKGGNLGDLYFQELCKSYGKQILSVSQNQTIVEVVRALRSSEATGKYFDRERQVISENFDFYYQKVIYFEYEGIECKALLDLVIVAKDSEGNIIDIFPFDLKTMSEGTLNFLGNLKKFRYDIQAAWYSLALAFEFKVNLIGIKAFTFIVESINYSQPLCYEIEGDILDIGLNGRGSISFANDIVIVREIKGITQLVEDYKWYEANGWDKERIIVENGEHLKINWNGIV